MKNKINTSRFEVGVNAFDFGLKNRVHPGFSQIKNKQSIKPAFPNDLPEILIITSYPPRECGIATYSQDLIRALNKKFSDSFSLKVCALEAENSDFSYPGEVKYILNTTSPSDYDKLAIKINQDSRISMVLIQHEFGFFNKHEQSLMGLLYKLSKPVIMVFHTVLPHPDTKFKATVQNIAAACESVIVMTNNASQLLKDSYDVPGQKISVIAHGTHLVPHLGKEFLKRKYGLTGRKVLTTFGLLSSGKSIETTLDALPAIIKENPAVLFLVIGKTHPEVLRSEGEKYRNTLLDKVVLNKLTEHVLFINSFLALPDLLEYLQLTDIYLFTTNDPNQAVSGTFAYAMSCACPIISTPIPHAKEVLTDSTGIIIDFRSSRQLADGVIRLLGDDLLRRNTALNTLEKIVPTAWENSAVSHAQLFKRISGNTISLQYNLPAINLDHLARMTTNLGLIQFSKVNQPDLSTGYTLDDNARALIAACLYFKATADEEIVYDIRKYLGFIRHCVQPSGDFLNYVDRDGCFTDQNQVENLDDSNGRAVWALGYLLSFKGLLPPSILSDAEVILKRSLLRIEEIHSTRAMAFTIKGLYYYYSINKSPRILHLLRTLADRLAQMYRHESTSQWEWFEAYLTYANSILPEALLYAWLLTGESSYKTIARSTLKFLVSQTFNENGIQVISNKNWLKRGEQASNYGEQPIDVAYTVMTLCKFYESFGDEEYRVKMVTAFNWFLGKNRLHQIMYNPCTGGCYDGLEDTHVNLNQGAESTVSYLMARLTVENARV